MWSSCSLICSRWTQLHKQGHRTEWNILRLWTRQLWAAWVANRARQVAPPRPMLEGLETEFNPGWKTPLKWSRWRKRNEARPQLTLEDLMESKKRKVKGLAYIWNHPSFSYFLYLDFCHYQLFCCFKFCHVMVTNVLKHIYRDAFPKDIVELSFPDTLACKRHLALGFFYLVFKVRSPDLHLLRQDV